MVVKSSTSDLTPRGFPGWRTNEFVSPDGALTWFDSGEGRPTHRCNIVFVPGWASTTRTWSRFMPRLSQEARVCYLETREKVSASIENLDAQTIDRASGDIADFTRHTFPDGNVVLVGASTGANLVLESYLKLGYEPLGLVLMTPHSVSFT
jgi:pimeloyl-ACP methyl ester carboxylesterase